MSRCNGSKISGPQTVVLIMAEKNPKTLTYTQEQNGSPYFSSMVGQCLWLSLPRKIAEKKLRQLERTSFIGSVGYMSFKCV